MVRRVRIGTSMRLCRIASRVFAMGVGCCRGLFLAMVLPILCLSIPFLCVHLAGFVFVFMHTINYVIVHKNI